MARDPFVSRLAERFRFAIMLIGAASAALVAGNLLTPLIGDRFVQYAASGVGILAAAMFACAVFDPRLMRAISALNAERRAETQRPWWRRFLPGLDLPVDRLLFAVGLALIVVTFLAANVFYREAASALGFAVSSARRRWH
jgi:hypothetical protein